MVDLLLGSAVGGLTHDGLRAYMLRSPVPTNTTGVFPGFERPPHRRTMGRSNPEHRGASEMDTPTTTLTESDERIVRTLVEEHVQVSCDLVPVDDHTWAIHGTIAVEGEVILAEFDDHDTAEAAVEEIAAAVAGERSTR
jgi:hypothetical protein